MRLGFCLFLLFVISGLVQPQKINEFDRPWNNSKNAIIIDAYHQNSIDWDKLRTDKRVVGIIHKSTEGFALIDSKYSSRKIKAKKHGYLWGSYHLLRKGNPIKQAKFYLKTVGKNTSDENNGIGR